MVRLALAGLGVLHLVNGLAMIADPMRWYLAVPGVARTGPPNMHFLLDIALAYAASGVGLLCAFGVGRAAAAFVLAGAIWPALHALVHVVAWGEHGAPAEAALSEGVGVIGAGLVSLALAAAHFRRQGGVHVQSLAAPPDLANGADVRL